jgi:hypothetical protein
MNKGIAIAISSILVGALLIWKWEVIKKILAPKTPPVDTANTGPGATPSPTNTTTGQNQNPTNTNGGSGTSEIPNNGNRPLPMVTVNLDKVFAAGYCVENKLGQLILQAVKVKQKLTIADINPDGQFGKKSVAAFDAIFPYQRIAKPFNLRTLVKLARETYDIQTDANANVIDEATSKDWNYWKDFFTPK